MLPHGFVHLIPNVAIADIGHRFGPGQRSSFAVIVIRRFFPGAGSSPIMQLSKEASPAAQFWLICARLERSATCCCCWNILPSLPLGATPRRPMCWLRRKRWPLAGSRCSNAIAAETLRFTGRAVGGVSDIRFAGIRVAPAQRFQPSAIRTNIGNPLLNASLAENAGRRRLHSAAGGSFDSHLRRFWNSCDQAHRRSYRSVDGGGDIRGGESTCPEDRRARRAHFALGDFAWLRFECEYGSQLFQPDCALRNYGEAGDFDAEELGRELDLNDVAQSVSRNFGSVFGSQMLWVETIDALLGHRMGVPMRCPKSCGSCAVRMIYFLLDATSIS
jgi:hypothetical protein